MRNILSTVNSGQKWTARNQPGATAGLDGIVCPSGTVCYAVGDNFSGRGEILGTENAAKVDCPQSAVGAGWGVRHCLFFLYRLRRLWRELPRRSQLLPDDDRFGNYVGEDPDARHGG